MSLNSVETCEINNIKQINNVNYVYEYVCPKVSNISYNDFFNKFLIQNKPCILLNVTENWFCKNEWLDENNRPNFNYLSNKYGNLDATVSNCKVRSYNAHKTEFYNLIKYIDYWQNYVENNYDSKIDLLYLKDWHLKKLTDEPFYTVPVYFSSDWLNEYFSEKTTDDYQFVYMGPKGTWTPFHADVFTSYSWSVNICGKKRWLLYPPGAETQLKDQFGNLPYDITNTDNDQAKPLEIIQNSGEALFVPSGWHHQVWNLDDTISINHNWINGCNIKWMWNSLNSNLNAVKKEIEDCHSMDNWLTHCQLMLKTSYGLDFEMFYHFLYFIADKRLKMLNNDLEILQFNKWLLGRNHAVFDLIQIRDVLELFIQHSDSLIVSNLIKNIDFIPNQLLLKINNTLSNFQ